MWSTASEPGLSHLQIHSKVEGKPVVLLQVITHPGPRGFLLILSFFIYLEICDAKRWSKRRAEGKESPWSRSSRISLSCWLSAWQLSKMSFSFDQSQRRIGSVLRYSYFVGRGEELLPCLQAVKMKDLQTSRVLFSFLKRDKLPLWHLKWKEKT